MNRKEWQYNELAFYTLVQPDDAFIHQHIVDARMGQTADEQTKPVSIVFALIGLYLLVEKGFNGRQVQQFHMKMSRNKRTWPEINLPVSRGNMDVSDVLAADPGPDRDEMIRNWCRSVWEAYKKSHSVIISLVEQSSK